MNTQTFRQLQDVRPPEIGAPAPVLVATEFAGSLAYRANQPDALAVLHFQGLYSTKWGPPNDKARAAKAGSISNSLYGSFEVINSAWLEELRAVGALDPRKPGQEWAVALRHFQFQFHDSTLDVAAEAYTTGIRYAPLHEVVPELAHATLRV